jgi:ABC-type uncharacterized transport system YnjBCD permease subunit
MPTLSLLGTPPIIPDLPEIPDSSGIFELMWNDPRNTIARTIDKTLVNQQATIETLSIQTTITTIVAIVVAVLFAVTAILMIRRHQRLQAAVTWLTAVASHQQAPYHQDGTLPAQAVAYIPSSQFQPGSPGRG